MKKAIQSPLLILTFLFCAGAAGFLLGNQRSAAIRVYASASAATSTAAAELPSPSTEAAAAAQESPQAPEQVRFPLNINSASREELMLLPGIGEVLSQRIVDYRCQNGCFSSIEDITNVQGIGAGILQSLRNYITTGG